ncbi:MAG: carbamate kinase [Coriobacteriia bacterium]
MSASDDTSLVVVALGGNANVRRGDDGTIEQQYSRTDESMRHIAHVLAHGHRMVLTHGNGPVVGNIMLRNEAARDQVAPMPLYIADADSEGGIGLMLQMSLYNQLKIQGLSRGIVTIVTQCVVDPGDPAFASPTKPIGPYFTAEQAAEREISEGWTFVKAKGSGMRRVVASPRPLAIVEATTIAMLAGAGEVVIAAGGGGVPVIEHADGTLEGIDAVIDKDWASALLACGIGADTLVILMEADRVYTDFGTLQQRPIDRLTADDAESLLGMLDRGSIGPKVAASAHFARTTGRDAIICGVEWLAEALAGRAGTRITAG